MDNEWEAILRAEGLAPLDESIRGRVVIRPRVSPGVSSILLLRREFAKQYPWRTKASKKCWQLYSWGFGPKSIARLLSCSTDYAKYTIRRVERARKKAIPRYSPVLPVDVEGQVILEFDEASNRFRSEPRTIKEYRKKTEINLWRPEHMSEVPSDQEIAAMLEQPTLTVVKEPVAEAAPVVEVPREKTVEEQEQEQFDAIVNGPFEPAFLRESAIKSFQYLLPVYLKGIKKNLQHAVARGAFMVPMHWAGPTNLLAGFQRELRALGLEAEIKGENLEVTLVKDGAELIAAGQI